MELKFELDEKDYYNYYYILYSKIKKNRRLIHQTYMTFYSLLLLIPALIVFAIFFNEINIRAFFIAIGIVFLVYIYQWIFDDSIIKIAARNSMKKIIKEVPSLINETKMLQFEDDKIIYQNSISKAEINFTVIKVVIITEKSLYLLLDNLAGGFVIPLYKLDNKDEIISYVKEHYKGDLREIK